MRGDLIENVNKLAAEKRFDYLLIESTGISEPMPVATTFVAEHEGQQMLGKGSPAGYPGDRRGCQELLERFLVNFLGVCSLLATVWVS